MGCNCKKIKKINNIIPNANGKILEKKGIHKYIGLLLNSLRTIFLKIIIAIVLIILCPLVVVVLIFNLFVINKSTIPLPNKIVKKMIRNDKN